MDNFSHKQKLFVSINKLSIKELENLDVSSWNIWEKEISEFDYHYDTKEECYFLEGEVTIVSGTEKYFIKKDDFVVFPKGFDCRWQITRAVRKHYRFS